MNELVIKQYKIDYDFIVKNYLSPKLWDMVWNLFVYNDTIVTLQLYSIDTRQRRISFIIKIKDSTMSRGVTSIITYDLQNSNYEVLKKQINGAIRSCITIQEEGHIEREEFYRRMLSSQYDERNILRGIAESFLDENNVSNDDIREAYIEKYIDDNETLYDDLRNYKLSRRYKVLSDLWLVFYKMIDDKVGYDTVISNLEEEDEELIERVTKLIEMFDKQEGVEFEDYIADMEYNLESI